jgi:hypothetical protein
MDCRGWTTDQAVRLVGSITMWLLLDRLSFEQVPDLSTFLL